MLFIFDPGNVDILRICASIHGFSLRYYKLLFLRQAYYLNVGVLMIALFVMR